MASDILTLIRDADKRPSANQPPVDPEVALVEEIIRRGPQSRKEFRLYIEKIIGPILEQEFGEIVDIGKAAVHGHISPIDAMWEIICLADGRDMKWNKLSRKALNEARKQFVLHACRGGMKTLGLAIIEHTCCNYLLGYSFSHTAAQEQQINAVWDYLSAFVGKGTVFHARCSKSTKYHIRYHNKSNIWRVVCTRDGLNSKHPTAFVIDEIESADWATVVEGLFSGQSKVKLGRPLMFIFASTQRQARATMFMLFDKCNLGKAKLMRWNWKTCVERCPDWRRDELPVGLDCEQYPDLNQQAIYLESMTGRTTDQEEQLLQTQHQIELLEGNCPLVSRCKGIAKSRNGFMGIGQLIEQLDSDPRAFDCQMACEQPSMENAVWEQLSDENRDDTLIYNSGARQVASIDYGYSLDDTAVLLANQVASSLEIWFEMKLQNCDEDTLIPHLTRLGSLYKVEEWSVDPSARKLIQKMIEAGLVVWTRKIDRDTGVNNVAYFVKSGSNKVRLKYNPKRCPNLHIQVMSYWRRVNGQPTQDRKEGHHWDFCDSLRYLCNMCRQGVRPGPKTLRESWAK